MTPLRVLVAEESPAVRQVLRSVFTGAGWTVLEAADGVSAVQRAFRDRPDVVVLDSRLPRLSGPVAARVLTRDWQTARTPVLLLAERAAEVERFHAEQCGAAGLLTREMEAGELVAAVGRVGPAAGGPGDPTGPKPVEMDAEEVLSRAAEAMERSLFEAGVVLELARGALLAVDLEPRVGLLLEALGRTVGFDAAAVLLPEDRAAYVAVHGPVSQRHYSELLGALAEAATAAGAGPLPVVELRPRVADPAGLLGAFGAAPMATFLAVPLRAGGRLVAVLALSSGTRNAYGEAALAALRLVEEPAAQLLGSARSTV